MADFVRFGTNNGGVLEAFRGLLRSLFEKDVIDAVMVPARLPNKQVIMQALIRDPKKLDSIDPLAPVVPTNAAKPAAQLTHDETGHSLAAVMRSCEIRALVELDKLNQAHLDRLLLIEADCLGRYETKDFKELDRGDETFTMQFYRDIQEGKGTVHDGRDLAESCKACEQPVSQAADIRICLIGADIRDGIMVQGVSDKGKEALAKLGLPEVGEPPGRDKALKALIDERTAYRKNWLSDMVEQSADIGGLMDVVSSCINCYNCRVACPVCYCRECVFTTATFQHDSEKFFQWADKRGMLRMPADTLFYHLTRMQHMSTLCVGCGQCTSACPNDIPVAQLFASVARETQKLFDYHPGRETEEEMPLAVFYEEEFEEVAAAG